MFLADLSIFIIVALFVSAPCNARVVDRAFADVIPTKLVKRADSCNIFSAICTPANCASCRNAKKRSLDTNSTILEEHFFSKRTLPPVPQDEIEDYYLISASQPSWIQIAPDMAGGQLEPSFCVQVDFSQQTGQLQMGTDDLHGCTVFLIVSARAAYVCHIWEDIHFTNADEMSGRRRFIGLEAFLDFLRGTSQNPLIVGDRLNRDLFTGRDIDFPTVYIMTPRSRVTPDDESSMAFPAQIQQLIDAFDGILTRYSVVTYNYFPLYVVGVLQQNVAAYQGAMMFEYDKNANGHGSPDWRVWTEEASRTGTGIGLDVQ